ncbi:MAG: dienelactone hydrolase family protein [Solirubrobacteraceae bacterium]
MAQTITRPLEDGTLLPIYEARPNGSAGRGVLVVQEAFGVNDHIEDVARRFAAAGYLAVAPHLFHRTGDPRLPYEPFEDVFPHLHALHAAEIEQDVDGALEHLRSFGLHDRSIAVVGFCMGGTVTFHTAARHALGAAVTFYGSGISAGRWGAPALVELAPGLRTPWLGFYGDRDEGIPIEEVEVLRRAATSAAVQTEVVRYADAGHGFHCDARAAFHKPSAGDAWERTLAWFAAHLRA